MFERVALAASAMPMARMSTGGLQTAGPVAGRSATPGGSAGPFGRSDRGRLSPGRLAPGRQGRGRSARGRSAPLAGADLASYRRRAAQLATLLESDRSHPTPGAQPLPGAGPISRPLLGDLGRRLGLVRVGVEALVADLDSVDAVEEEARPLRELVAELGRVAARGGSDARELERVREWALAVLRAFAAADDGRGGAQGGEPPSRPAVREREPGRDPGFWRR
jgi:hypothetical protein